MTANKSTNAHLSADIIKRDYPNFKPKIGIILGSGLGSFTESLSLYGTLKYEHLPGFPKMTVHGHGGDLVLGNCFGVDLVCLKGRNHGYEGQGYDAVTTYVRTLKLLGCEYFLATNAAGSLREDVGPGELMLVTDHINMQPGNPLVGDNDPDFGPRFFPLDQAYDNTSRETLLALAKQEQITLHQGVYLSVLGPNYETAAEIRAFRILGADAVGMSTVPEVLVATHCGLKVAVISMITNFATGLSKTSHCHHEVVHVANNASARLNRLITAFVQGLA
ncbi:MAG: purine-nucleoside phosphorylase [Legionellales bacterium]|nr:purine-nucleoside phosphorylase [Legionellales bacterium]